jgi:hypothetical protein
MGFVRSNTLWGRDIPVTAPLGSPPGPGGDQLAVTFKAAAMGMMVAALAKSAGSTTWRKSRAYTLASCAMKSWQNGKKAIR